MLATTVRGDEPFCAGIFRRPVVSQCSAHRAARSSRVWWQSDLKFRRLPAQLTSLRNENPCRRPGKTIRLDIRVGRFASWLRLAGDGQRTDRGRRNGLTGGAKLQFGQTMAFKKAYTDGPNRGENVGSN